jgi:hypothetical protein
VTSTTPKKVVEVPLIGNGAYAEKEFAKLLRAQQWMMETQDYPDVTSMFDLAAKYHAAKLQTILDAEGGTLTALRSQGPKVLMDWIYKADFLLDYINDHGKRVRVSVDITTDVSKTEQKGVEIIRKQATLSKLGVQQACVIVWNIKRGQPPYLKVPLLQHVRDKLANSKYFCSTIVLY